MPYQVSDGDVKKLNVVLESTKSMIAVSAKKLTSLTAAMAVVYGQFAHSIVALAVILGWLWIAANSAQATLGHEHAVVVGHRQTVCFEASTSGGLSFATSVFCHSACLNHASWDDSTFVASKFMEILPLAIDREISDRLRLATLGTCTFSLDMRKTDPSHTAAFGINAVFAGDFSSAPPFPVLGKFGYRFLDLALIAESREFGNITRSHDVILSTKDIAWLGPRWVSETQRGLFHST